MINSEPASSKECFVGVDLGGTNMKAVSMDREGNVFCEENIPTESEKGPAAVIKRMISLMNSMKHNGAVGDRVLHAIGIAAPGVIDMKEGICKFLPNFPTGWRNIPLAKKIGEGTGSQAFLINDVRAMTLGEKTFGAGKGIKNLICLSLGTGIGGGIVIDDKLYFGKEGFAGEIGHQAIELHGNTSSILFGTILVDDKSTL